MMNERITLRQILKQVEEGYLIPCFRETGRVDLFGKSFCGDTLLHVAAAMGAYEQVVYLCSKGLDINAKGDFFETPLFLASRRDNWKMYELLIRLGADPRAMNSYGECPEDLWRKTSGGGCWSGGSK